MTRRDFGREAVVEAIRQRAGSDHAAVVSIPTLASEAGLSIEGVRQALRRAVAEHELSIEPQGPNSVNRYRLVNGARSTRAGLVRSTTKTAQVRAKQTPRPPVSVGHLPPSDLPPSFWPPPSTADKGPTGPIGIEQALALWDTPPLVLPPQVQTLPPASHAPTPARTRRPPNAELWEAIRDAWLGEGTATTKGEAGRIGKAARDLAEVGATPGDVVERYARLLTWAGESGPQGLVNNWSALGRPLRVAERARGSRGRVGSDRERILSLERTPGTDA